jgi:hypothetical protein
MNCCAARTAFSSSPFMCNITLSIDLFLISGESNPLKYRLLCSRWIVQEIFCKNEYPENEDEG